MRKQRGLSLMGLLLVSFAFILVVLLGLRIGPAYIEFFKIKKATTGMVASGDARRLDVPGIRAYFDKRATIDDFEAISGRDLEITKDSSGEVVLSFAYQKEIKLFGNISLLINFSGSSQR
jgi:hypothetical protein